MNNNEIIQNNKSYWNEHADLWFGTTALPEYGVHFVTEDDLHLFGDVSGKRCWTTDLEGTFKKIASYLKKDGIFIFSWHHPLHYCVSWSCSERKDIIENDKLTFDKSYFDESYFRMPVHDSEIILCNRKISTYVNALARAGFGIEQMVEQTDQGTMEAVRDVSDKMKKAKMLPISVCFKARKL